MTEKTKKLPAWVKWGLSLLTLLILGFVIFIWWLHEPKPAGTSGPEADALAQQMLAAVNKSARDTTTFVQWTFKGMHDYLWDKERHFTRVRWKDNEVLLDINAKKGIVYQNGEELNGPQADQLVIKAWEFWANDSFWLNAPVKAFDPGTQRYLVDLENGQKGLMVSYNSGGVTPGDSYLWILDDQNRPKSWKMWVKIIPIGGLEFSWQDWTTLSTGAKIATMHKNPILDLDITNVAGGNNLDMFGEKEDPFTGL